MKSAIITLTKMYNYGNSLQNYAVQEVLKAFGLNSETIIYEFRTPMELIKSRIKKLLKYKDGRKKALFDKFEKDYIIQSRFRDIKEYHKKVEDYFDYYFVGSDQVWNATWYDRYSFMKDVFLLSFTNNSKKIAYAASFGVQDLPDKWKPWFREYLGKFKAISVREDAGKNIVEDLTGKTAEVIIDPTMMLDVEVWRKIENDPNVVEGKYVLTYFLSPPNADALRLSDKLGRQYKVININDVIIASSVGPTEFLWLFDHADLILTDSFHGSVFSILFDKPFQVFDRQSKDVSMMSRITTLLSKFGLERKYAGSGIENDLWEHDYEEAYIVLRQERMKAKQFINDAIC